jgi:hypothetical protein
MSDTNEDLRHVDDDPSKSTIEPDDPVWLRAELGRTRREAARYRQEARTLREGPEGAGVKALHGEIRDLKVRTGIAESLHKHGVARPALLRAYLIDSGAMQRLDPASADFSEQIDTAIGEALEAEPGLKGRGSTASVSGVEFPGGSSQHTNNQLTREEVAAMSPEDVVKARAAGQLNNLLGRK